ncbi:hypothetical protein [Kineococcus aurantiacus]|uniref:Uncharacterized protein n=1 Tax=Kineococcus aurantiacus TaxID=37633 RepID=A0A7Y9IZZ8_9ACTN|nr:hypothetical protein [Kineococcus aurantiacus]NYD21981.1 hypothetical protein [Kineococcus aurantiacus]
MSALVVLILLVALAVAAPMCGADTRWPGAGARPDKPRRGKRYRLVHDAATAHAVRRDQFDRTS